MASRVNCRFGRINLNLPSCEKSQHGAADTNKSTCMCDLEESYPFTTQNASVQSCSGREIFYGSVFGREGVGDDTTEATESFGGLHRRAQDPPDHHPHGRRGRWLDNVFIDRLWRSVPTRASICELTGRRGRSGRGWLLRFLHRPAPSRDPGPRHPGRGVLQCETANGSMRSSEVLALSPCPKSRAHFWPDAFMG